VQPPVVPEYVEDLNDRISDVISRPIDVNGNLYQLILSIQSRILEVDNQGNVHEGQLPFITQATLYRGTETIAFRSDMTRYPGVGSNIFDPMLGEFFPVTNDIVFTLINAPEGVSIDEKGLITVSKNAALETQNDITVQAEYQGQVYRAKLYIKCGVYTPRSLGVCYIAPTSQVIKIREGGEDVPYIAYQGDWVTYKGETLGMWLTNKVYRWTGIQWVMLQPPSETNRENANYYLEANGYITEGAPEAVFSFAQVRSLVASSIFTNLIGAKQIIINEGGFIQSEATDPVTGEPLFLLKADGFMKLIGLIAEGGEFYNINIKNKYNESDFINKGTLAYNRNGYYSTSITLTPGWYFIDMAGGGGGNGGRAALDSASGGGTGGSGGVIKNSINIITDVTCYIYIGERGKNAVNDNGGAAGRGHKLDLYGVGKNGASGGIGGAVGSARGATGGNGGAWNDNNATNGGNGTAWTANYPEGGGGGGGGNSILYIPNIGILFCCSGGGGGGGEGRSSRGGNGDNGTNSINNNTGNITNGEGYIKIYKAP
jgi:hypothetical protein